MKKGTQLGIQLSIQLNLATQHTEEANCLVKFSLMFSGEREREGESSVPNLSCTTISSLIKEEVFFRTFLTLHLSMLRGRKRN